LYFQPKIDAISLQVTGAEALLRWHHPERGLISPVVFIPLAEQTDLIIPLGDWVLGEACRWANFIGTERGLPVAVNLSARQFNDPKLTKLVARVLRDSGLPPRLLELEIAEPSVMQNPEFSLLALGKLRGLGVSVVIDGFGAAYSSLVGLRQLPLNKLKIDRSLVAEVHREGKAIVAGIVGLAHALGLKVAAVGVETEVQKAALASCGCDYLQGFLTGAPVDAETASRDYV